MRSLQHASKDFPAALAAFCSAAAAPREIADAVTAILADVKQRGDEAISYYAAKFDGAKLRGRDFPLKPADLAAGAKRLPAPERRALVAAHDNIAEFHRQALPKNWTAKNKH